MSPIKNHQYNVCCIKFFPLLLCSPYLFSETCIQLWYFFFLSQVWYIVKQTAKARIMSSVPHGELNRRVRASTILAHQIRWQKLRLDCGGRGAFRAFTRQQFPPSTRSSAHRSNDDGNGDWQREAEARLAA